MITSTDNKQIKKLHLLNTKARARREQGVFIAEGWKMFQEAPVERVENVYVSDSFLCTGEYRKLLEGREYETVSDAVFSKISDTQTPQGILTVVRQISYTMAQMVPVDKPAHILILESLQDPGNLGTMIRTGEGAGITGVIMNQTTVDVYNPKTIRSTMGSIYRVPHRAVEDLGEAVLQLQRQGIKVYAAHLEESRDYDTLDLTGPSGFLIGNEGNGLTREMADLADSRLRIPMEGKVESLNAAVAASLLMYEAQRQRRKQRGEAADVSTMG